ncbi:HEAT repeat domain-containing protein [Streptomyces antibioticus]|uniref:hypothetical protein n=1 Tax=Streptomyces antibioticus TaxID=1890 RepID=UPI00225145F8|nr:hypothetical protein [Streptomyces antibioticus]MCX4741417.1 hypothetical protein [Streptomyces antibioticus]
MSSDGRGDDIPRVGQQPGPDGSDQDVFSPLGIREFGFAGAFGELGAAFLGAVRATGAVGESAEAEYQRALDVVRGYPAEDVDRLARSGWEELPEEAYLDRWALVQVLTDLRLAGTADALAAVVATPVPPERYPEGAHRYSTVGQETVIRTTAVEGLARLAADGSTGALDTLVRHVDDDRRGVRAACVLALRELAAPVDLPGLIRSEDADLLEVRRYDVRDVPQVTRVDHIRYPGAGADVRPPPP